MSAMYIVRVHIHVRYLQVYSRHENNSMATAPDVLPVTESALGQKSLLDGPPSRRKSPSLPLPHSPRLRLVLVAASLETEQILGEGWQHKAKSFRTRDMDQFYLKGKYIPESLTIQELMSKDHQSSLDPAVDILHAKNISPSPYKTRKTKHAEAD